MAAISPARRRSPRDAARRPYAYVVPQAQRDPVAAVEMLRRLAFAGVRVSRLTADETIEGERFPEGTWIVPADQEFAALAREVLDVQKYPEIRESPGGPLDQPYDAAGWTLPLSMGVRTVYVQAPLSEDVRRRMKLVADPAGEKIKPSPYTSVRNSDAAAVRQRAGHRLRFRADGEGDRPAGRPHRRVRRGARRESGREQRLQGDQPRLEGGRHASGSMRRPLCDLGSERSGAGPRWSMRWRSRPSASPSRQAHRGKPRLGLFLANTSMDEGWTRWVLEQYEFQFTRVSGADIQAGSLRDRIDVLVITDEPQGVLLGGGGRGGRGGGGGDRAAANDAEARAAIEAFVRGGGTLVCFNRSSSVRDRPPEAAGEERHRPASPGRASSPARRC